MLWSLDILNHDIIDSINNVYSEGCIHFIIPLQRSATGQNNGFVLVSVVPLIPV